MSPASSSTPLPVHVEGMTDAGDTYEEISDYLKDQGVYAISENMADTLIEGIRDASDGMNRFSDATDLAEETMSESLTEALGDEDGELSADMADTLRDSGYYYR